MSGIIGDFDGNGRPIEAAPFTASPKQRLPRDETVADYFAAIRNWYAAGCPKVNWLEIPLKRGCEPDLAFQKVEPGALVDLNLPSPAHRLTCTVERVADDRENVSVYRLTPVTHFCPDCGGELWHSAGEDEFGTNELHPYDRWECLKCRYWCDTEDFDDA